MSNPFDNVPSSADVPGTINKKDITALTAAIERFETAVSREETTVKNQEELAGALFEIFLDDDGTLKDFAQTKRFESTMNRATQKQEEVCDRVENAVHSVPTRIEVRLCEEDRNCLDKNFQSWNSVFKLHLPLFCVIGFIVGLCILVCVLATKSATDKRRQYEYHLEHLNRWELENTQVTSLGHFYHEHYPNSYHKCRTGYL